MTDGCVCTRRVRRYVHCLVTSSAFDTFIIVIICASCITLAAEDPVNSSSLRNLILSYIDHAFTVLYTVEMLLKVNKLTANFFAGVLQFVLLEKVHSDTRQLYHPFPQAARRRCERQGGGAVRTYLIPCLHDRANI